MWKLLHPHSGAVAVYEFVGATLDEVELWARENAELGYSLALARPVADGLECVWLRGKDPNDSR